MRRTIVYNSLTSFMFHVRTIVIQRNFILCFVPKHMVRNGLLALVKVYVLRLYVSVEYSSTGRTAARVYHAETRGKRLHTQPKSYRTYWQISDAIQ